MTRATNWRLGICPSRDQIAAWDAGTVDDWNLGQHILECPACLLDLSMLQAGEPLEDLAPSSEEPLPFAMSGAPHQPPDHRPTPVPGSLWVLRVRHPHAPMDRVVVLDVAGTDVHVGLLLPADEPLPNDVEIDSELPLVAAAGVIEELPADALASCFGHADAATVERVAAAVHVDPGREDQSRTRAWHALRFARTADELRPPAADELDDLDLGPAMVAELTRTLRWAAGPEPRAMGAPAGTGAKRQVRTLRKDDRELPAPILEHAGWCEPRLILDLERHDDARVTGSVSAIATDGPFRFAVRLTAPDVTWETGGPHAELAPTSARARFAAPGTLRELTLRIELVVPR